MELSYVGKQAALAVWQDPRFFCRSFSRSCCCCGEARCSIVRSPQAPPPDPYSCSMSWHEVVAFVRTSSVSVDRSARTQRRTAHSCRVLRLLHIAVGFFLRFPVCFQYSSAVLLPVSAHEILWWQVTTHSGRARFFRATQLKVSHLVVQRRVWFQPLRNARGTLPPPYLPRAGFRSVRFWSRALFPTRMHDVLSI